MTDTTTAALIGAGVVSGALLSIIGLAGVVWRLALPWLREQIVKPVQATQEQVSNSHKSNLRDDIDRLTGVVNALRDDVACVGSQVKDVDDKASRIGRQLDAHLTSAATTDSVVHTRLTALETRQERP